MTIEKPIDDDAAASRWHASLVAMGESPADLVLTGGRVVDVVSGRIMRADVAIAGSRIAAVGDVSQCLGPGTRRFDCDDRFLLPGFLDPHFHVGYSQVTVERLAEVMVPRGTVALGTCFAESGMIAGRAAVEDQLHRSAATGLDLLLSPFHAAAIGLGEFGNLGRYTMDDQRALVRHPRCVELREWNYAVSRLPVDGQREVWAEALRHGRAIGGHLEGLSGAALQAAAAQGVVSDHEATTPQQAVERARLGITVQMREGSAARDLLRLLPALTEYGADPRYFSVCSDEQELHELVELGHLDHKLRMLVRNGVAPIDAVRMVTLNAARSLGVERDYGAIAPGRLASLALVEDLAGFRVSHVFARGDHAAREGSYQLPDVADPYPERWQRTTQLAGPLRPADFALPVPYGTHRLRVIGMSPGSLLTEELHLGVRVAGGSADRSGADLAKIAVIDRHEASGRRAVGLIAGFGISRGAFASTINPGMMNLMVVGVDDRDMALCANRVAELGGGIVVAEGGSIVAEISLPVFGIVSHAPLAESVAACAAIAAALRERLGSAYPGLIPAAGFACLAASIPALKITDRGLVRVDRGGAREPVGLVV